MHPMTDCGLSSPSQYTYSTNSMHKAQRNTMEEGDERFQEPETRNCCVIVSQSLQGSFVHDASMIWLPVLFFFFLIGSLAELVAHPLARLTGQGSVCLCPQPPSIRVPVIQTQVLLLVQQTLQQVSHLPSAYFHGLCAVCIMGYSRAQHSLSKSRAYLSSPFPGTQGRHIQDP